ncbi:MAG: hypothetical protein WCY48_03385, partial [Candidatus Caldatribacteriota bacterium]
FLGREMDKTHIYNPNKSNWVSIFGLEAQGLPVERNYSGQNKSFSNKDEVLTGARIGIGRDFYLGKGFVTRTQIEGYFVGTLFEPKKSVGGGDLERSFSQKQGNIWGGEVSQVLSYITEFNAPAFMLDHKIKMYFEPFIEAGIGMGKSFFRFNYQMRTDSLNEDYRTQIDNSFVSQKFSVGINLIAQNGYFFTMKASQVAHQISDSKSFERVNGVKRDLDQKNDTVNLAFSYYLGGGYRW